MVSLAPFSRRALAYLQTVRGHMAGLAVAAITDLISCQ